MYNKVLITTVAAFLMFGCTANNELTKSGSDNNAKRTQSSMDGEALYQKSCTKCHSTSVHTRTDRTVKSLDSLKNRVAKCNANVGTNLTNDEVDAISNHLNAKYYKF